MKTAKTILITIAAAATVLVSSAFVAPAISENNITVTSVDGTNLCISLAPVQVKGLVSLLPEAYRSQFKDSYGRFRTQALSHRDFSVDGINVARQSCDDGESCTLSGKFDSFGQHTLTVNIGSMEDFIAVMDNILIEE